MVRHEEVKENVKLRYLPNGNICRVIELRKHPAPMWDSFRVEFMVVNKKEIPAGDRKTEIYTVNGAHLALFELMPVTKYSDATISDDNFNEELEMLCEKLGINQTDVNARFETELPEGVTKQTNDTDDNWFEEWRIEANQTCELAYEFANGFIVVRNIEPV